MRQEAVFSPLAANNYEIRQVGITEMRSPQRETLSPFIIDLVQSPSIPPSPPFGPLEQALLGVGTGNVSPSKKWCRYLANIPHQRRKSLVLTEPSSPFIQLLANSFRHRVLDLLENLESCFDASNRFGQLGQFHHFCTHID